MEQNKELSTESMFPMGLENNDNFFNGILAADQSMQNGSDNSKVNFPMKR